MSKAETKLKKTLKTLYKQVHEYYRENGIEDTGFDSTEMLNYASICVCDTKDGPCSWITLHNAIGGFDHIEAIF